MKIGVPREVKDHEYRVGMIPAIAHALVERGHQVAWGPGSRTASTPRQELCCWTRPTKSSTRRR
jgi:NAD/NADP transhydrogenase alpha subunit